MEQSYAEVENMTQEQGRPDSSEIRRALDNLQQTLETLSNRYQELRRERKQLRARIEELERERENQSLSLSTRLEAAAIDRRRVSELELRIIAAEKGQAELLARIADLESTLGERDAFIVEQEDTIGRLRERIESDRKREEEGWGVEEKLREEIAGLNERLALAQADLAGAERRALELERREPATVEAPLSNELQEQLAGYRRRIEELQGERSRLEEQQLQLIGKLDIATRDSGLARTRTAELESQLRLLEEIQGMHEEGLARESLLAEQVNALQRRLLAAEMENEGAAKAVSDLIGQRDQARQKVDTLLTRLTLIEAGDDERLKAQQMEIAILTRDLTEALDMAARKETEAVEAGNEVERLNGELLRSQRGGEALLAECESLRGRLAEASAGQAPPEGGIPEGVREDMVRQLSEAIRLIDKHIEGA